MVGGLGRSGDGNVHVAFNLLEDNGTTRAPFFFVTPEPATFRLLGFALAACAWLPVRTLRKRAE